MESESDLDYRRACQKRDSIPPLPPMTTVFLDTETTGLGDEIVEICICDETGKSLLLALVRPTGRTTWPEAQAIHGITPEAVAHAPALAELMPFVRAAIQGKRVVIYNAPFDVKFFPFGTFEGCDVECAMLKFAERVGDWNEHRRNWKWHKLTAAAEYVGHVWEGDAHRARADVLATISVWNWLQDTTKTNDTNDTDCLY